MSKVGKLPVAIPAGVTVNVADGVMTVKGPKGELKQTFHDEIDIKVQGTEVILTPKNETKQTNAYHGLYRSLLNNMVKSVEYPRFIISSLPLTSARKPTPVMIRVFEKPSVTPLTMLLRRLL